MARERTAAVFVEKDWYDDTLRLLIDRPKSQSTTRSHLLIGELGDAGNHGGVWFKNVPSPHIKDGQVVNMDYMVPWRVILGVGTVDEPDAFKTGFQPGAFTVLE